MPALSGSAKAYKNARLNVARLGASRLGYVDSLTLRLLIDGTARQAYCFPESIEITQVLANQYTTATLRVYGFTPTVGQTVTIGLGTATWGDRLFAGRILAVRTVIASRSIDRKVYDLTCVDWTWDLNRRLVTQYFESQPVDQILRQLITDYCSGFTSTAVQTGLGTVQDQRFRFERVTDALSRLTEQVGAYWYVDEDKDLHVYTTEPQDSTPETISTSSVHEWRNLAHTADLSQVRTRVYAEGGGVRLVGTRLAADQGTVGYATHGLYSTGPLTNDENLFTDQPMPGVGTADRYLVDEALYRVGLNTVASTPTTTSASAAVGAVQIQVASLTSVPTAGIVLIDGQYIRYTGSSAGSPNLLTGIPASGEGSIMAVLPSGADVIVPWTINFNGYVHQTHNVGAEVHTIRCRTSSNEVTELAALDGSDGIREGWVRDERQGYLTTAARGDAEMLAWANVLEGIRYDTRDPNVRAGRTVTVNVAGLSGTYRIQKVSIRGIEESPHLYPWRSVEASSVRFDFYDLLARVSTGRL